MVETPFGSIRLHHWLSSDDARNLHDHPWWFVSLILRGGYVDHSDHGDDRVGPGSIRFRHALHRHSVRVEPRGCWSLLVTGPRIRRWGFWVRDKFKKANKYFLEHGEHPCD